MMGSGAAGAPGPEIENVWTVPVLATDDRTGSEDLKAPLIHDSNR